MPNKQDLPHLINISKYLEKMLRFSNNLSLEEFSKNELVFDACVLNFINLAEAFKLLSENFKLKYTSIPFNKITGMRNIAAHGYEGLDPRILYDTIKNELPWLAAEINRILKNDQ